MAYGSLKVDNIIFTNGGVDQTITVSGIVSSTSGDLTVTGTISGAVIQGGTLVSGATVTGTTANFSSGVFTTTVSGAAATIGTATITSGVFALGTAALPSITPTGDPNTGIFSPGADQLAISTGGTGRLFVGNTGRVGIGAISTDFPFTVSNTGTDSSIGIAAANTANSEIFFGDTDSLYSGRIRYGHSSDSLQFWTNSSERLRITSAGLVGIGTSAPSQLLHVKSASSSTTGLFEADGNSTVEISRSSAVSLPGSSRLLVSAYGRLGITSDDYITFSTGLNGSSIAERLRIDNSGRVGIGIANPASILDVVSGSIGGTVFARFRNSDASAGSGAGIAFNVGSGAPASGNTLATIYASKEGAGINSSLIFTTNNGSVAPERARIDSSGRLLLNTSTSVAAGSVAASTLQVSQGASGVGATLYSLANASGPGGILVLGHGRTTTAGLLSSGDVVGQIRFAAGDGVDLETQAALISVEVDGTPGANDMPGRLVFSTTADGAASPTERMRIDSSGRVGLGTASPIRPLSVSNGGAEGFEFGPGDGAGYNLTLHYNRSTSAYIGAVNQASYHTWSANGAVEKMRLDTSGRLLLGTSSSPSVGQGQYSRFVVQGYIGGDASAAYMSLARGEGAASITSDETIGVINFTDNAGNAFAQIVGDADAAAGSGDYPGRLVFSTTADGASSPTERLRITSTGLVGIGTTTPTVALDVVGGINASSTLGVTGVSTLGVVNATASSSTVLALNRTTTDGDIATFNVGGTPCFVFNSVGARNISVPGANPLAFNTNSLERARIDSSGRLGIGTSAPEQPLDIVGNLQIRSNAVSGSPLIVFDAKEGGGGARRSVGQIQSVAESIDGWGMRFYTRTNGVAMSEKLRITNAGNVGIGTTGPGSTLDVRGNVRLGNQANGDGTTVISASNGVFIGTNDGSTSSTVVPLQIGAYPASPGYSSTPDQAIVLDGWSGSTIYHNAIVNRKGRELSFHTAITGNSFTDTNERARIDSSGRLLLGTSSSRSNIGGNTAFGSHVQIESAGTDLGTLSLINNFAVGYPAAFTIGATGGSTVGSNSIVNAQEDIGIINFVAADGTNLIRAASITAFVDGTPGANDMPGRLVLSTTANGAATPTERMRIKADGFVNIGTGDTDIIWNQTSVTGITLSEAGVIQGTRDSDTVMLLNRLSNDGALVVFSQAGVQEGTISVSGSTVSYNGAHLARWSQLPSGAARTEILRGSVLSNLDEMCEWGEENNEQLNRMKVSDVEGDKNVSGVFQAWDDDDDTYINDFYCAMTGDFVIRIAQGTTVARGDLLMSAGDGTAKPQDDDIIRSKTIAKVTSTHVTCTYDDGSYCVPCVLMAC